MAVAAPLGGVGSGERRLVARELDEPAYARAGDPERDDRPRGDREELHRGGEPGVPTPQMRGLVPKHAREGVLFAGDEKAAGKHDPRREEADGHRPEIVVLDDGARDAVGALDTSRAGESATETRRAQRRRARRGGCTTAR